MTLKPLSQLAFGYLLTLGSTAFAVIVEVEKPCTAENYLSVVRDSKGNLR